MAKPDQLHALISSLTSHEKRYVSLFASRHLPDEASNQLKLFEALIGLKEYDEAKLVLKLDSKSIARHLSSEKNQLFHTILQAMRIYHEERSTEARIRGLITDAEFLFEKRLYDSNLDLLKKAREMADKYERRLLMLEILQMEASSIKEKKSVDPDKLLAENHRLQEKTLKQLEEETQLLITRNTIFSAGRQLFLKQNAFPDELPSWLHGPARIDEQKGFTYNYHYLSAIALFRTGHGQHAEAAETYEQLRELWKLYPSRFESERLPYKKMLSNSIVVNQLLGKNETVAELIGQLRKHPCRTAEEEAEQFQTTAFAELMLFMNSGKWEGIEKLVKNIEAGLKTYKTKINRARELAFRFNISICWLVIGNYKNALQWINQIIETEKTDHRRDLQQLARLFRLILYYELGKHDLLEYEMVNVERYLKQRKAWSAWEGALFKLIRSLLDTEQGGHAKHFDDFLRNADKLTEGKDSATLPGSSEILLWAKSRLSDRPIHELLNSL